jgi:hypothetical protein
MSADETLQPGQFWHGSWHRIDPSDTVRTPALPIAYGHMQHNYFTTNRQVAEDSADTRRGGPGYLHVVEPTGPYEVDRGEEDSYRSEHPLRVLSVRAYEPPKRGRQREAGS